MKINAIVKENELSLLNEAKEGMLNLVSSHNFPQEISYVVAEYVVVDDSEEKIKYDKLKF